MPARPKKSSESSGSQIQEDELPNLKPNTLLSLTEKIQQNLRKAPNEEQRRNSALKTSKKQKKESQSPPEVKLPVRSLKPSIHNERRKNGNANFAGTKSPQIPAQQQGKKRLRDGQVKESPTRRDVNKTKLRTKGSKDPKASFDIEAEILELGGTKDDYELVAEALSDSAIEGEDVYQVNASRSELQKDLTRLVKELGVEKALIQQEEEEEESYPSSEDEGELTNGDLVATYHNVSTMTVDNEKLPRPSTKNMSESSFHLYFEPLSEWHAAPIPELPMPLQNHTVLSQDLSSRVHQFAKSLLDSENTQHALRNKSSSSAHQFYSTIMSSGTLSDKISALTLSVQESPIHNVKALESLVGLARKRSRGQAVEVLGALKDLFGPGALLPSDRKLKLFASQPGLIAAFSNNPNWSPENSLPKPLKEVHLIVWAYEDWLKSIYFEILRIIETWCNDEVVFARVKAVDYVCQLLKEKPEQEANLLRLLVNKLGDSDKKIASRTSYSILQLETTHPLMKSTIIASIESDLLFRPGQSLHAQYYAIITLNQTVLSSKEGNVARKLVDIYFSLFVKILERPEAAEAAKLATSGANSLTINRKGDVQRGGGVPGKKALKKQALHEKSANIDEDLREKMLSAVLTGVNRAIPFMATDDETFEKHLNTLFRVTHSSNFSTSIQALMLIEQLTTSQQGTADRFYRTLYESLLDPRLLTSSKQALYLNLLFRALRADLNVKRVKAFAKRLLQVVTMHQPSFTAGALYLLRELESIFANLRNFLDQGEEADSDEDEKFQDVQEDGDGPRPHLSSNTEDKLVKAKFSRAYDGRKRDPEHSNAENGCLWELTPFLMHFHPSVALFATKLLSHESMPPKPDLSAHTLIHFLDRFVYKNAKATSESRGSSIMQPMAGGDASGILMPSRSTNSARAPVNSESFWRMESGKVDADEVFFHKYFASMGKGKDKVKKKKAERKAKDGDDSDAGDDEDEIWKALVDSRPEIEGSDQSDSDMDGLDSAMDDDEDEEANSAVDEPNAGDTDMGEDFEMDAEAFDLGDDDDALLSSNDEAPSDLEKAFSDEVQYGKEQPLWITTDEKRSKKRHRLKNLPTFASADDYAKMLDDNDGEDGQRG